MSLPCDVCRVKDSQSLVVLMVCHTQVLLEVIETSVSDIGSVEERAQEQDCQDGKDSTWLSDGCDSGTAR